MKRKLKDPASQVGCPHCGAEPAERCVSRSGKLTGYHVDRRERAEQNEISPASRWQGFTEALTALDEAKSKSPSAWVTIGVICFGLIGVGLLGLLIDDQYNPGWALLVLIGAISSIGYLLAGTWMRKWEL